MKRTRITRPNPLLAARWIRGRIREAVSSLHRVDDELAGLAESLALPLDADEMWDSRLAGLGFDPAELGTGGPGQDLTALGDAPRTVFFLTFGRGRPGWMGKARPDRPKFIGLRRGDVKFFVDRDRFRHPERGRCFLYDLAADPHEKENLCDQKRRDEARRYRRELVDWYSDALAGR